MPIFNKALIGGLL